MLKRSLNLTVLLVLGIFLLSDPSVLFPIRFIGGIMFIFFFCLALLSLVKVMIFDYYCQCFLKEVEDEPEHIENV